MTTRWVHRHVIEVVADLLIPWARVTVNCERRAPEHLLNGFRFPAIRLARSHAVTQAEMMWKRSPTRFVELVLLTVLFSGCGSAASVGSRSSEPRIGSDESVVDATSVAPPATIGPPPSISVNIPQTTLPPAIEAVTCPLTFTPHDTATPPSTQSVVVTSPGTATTPIGDLLFTTTLTGESFAGGELTLSIAQSPDYPVIFTAHYRFPADPYINSFEESNAGFTGDLELVAPTSLSQLSFSCTAT